ncbi:MULTISPECIES: nucleotidyltransferase domain-containing protein [Microbacterium]|uniref:nucleotidyltransferase domain-containing protein n=1 Tax=Microbacterium TaxID=33882 RepID=UPI001F0D9C51|nr:MULTISPECIES: nucleotidyltransferase domain-containing protein [Microbacterium]
MSDAAFLEGVADRLITLEGAEAVALGGSRAQGTSRADSDWDLAVYYRGDFRPQALRDIGWPGHVSELGEWGGGVFNGGAWLTIDGRHVDIHYRDLEVVDRELEEARAGRFRIEQLMFHLAGIPTYLLVAELAVNRTLRGDLPKPEYPPRLRSSAPPQWWSRAEALFDYARSGHASHGRAAQAVAMAVEAATCAAHAVSAARATWVTNEKRLLESASLRDFLDDRLLTLDGDAEAFVDDVARRCAHALALAEDDATQRAEDNRSI